MTALPSAPCIAGVTWRAAVLEDVQAIAELQDACLVVDDGYPEAASEVAERFVGPLAEASADSLVGVLDSGAIIMSLWSYLVPEPVSVWSVYDDNYIHPDHRTADLRAFALNWWQARSLQRTAAGQDPDPPSGVLPIRFHQHVYPGQLQHIEDITRRGFEPWIYFDELTRDLSAPIGDIALAEGYEMVLSASVPALDLLAIRNDAFRDHTGSQPWTLELWESQMTEMHRADASFVVLKGTEAVAFVKCAVFPRDAVHRGFSEGWIEQVGTKRGHRGRGLAASLIRASMAVFASDGIEYATLEVDTESPTGAHGLYTSLGFKRVRGYVDYTNVVEQ